jgi:hypothetical protein
MMRADGSRPARMSSRTSTTTALPSTGSVGATAASGMTSSAGGVAAAEGASATFSMRMTQRSGPCSCGVSDLAGAFGLELVERRLRIVVVDEQDRVTGGVLSKVAKMRGWRSRGAMVRTSIVVSVAWSSMLDVMTRA